MVQLTPREQQVMDALLTGKRYRQIGVELGLRRNYIAMLAKRVYRSLGVDGRAGLLRLAIVRGWVPRTDRGLTWTRREQLVLDGLLQGRTQKNVAAGLGISLKTMELTLRAMRRYARTHTTAELIRVAVEQGAGML